LEVKAESSHSLGAMRVDGGGRDGMLILTDHCHAHHMLSSRQVNLLLMVHAVVNFLIIGLDDELGLLAGHVLALYGHQGLFAVLHGVGEGGDKGAGSGTDVVAGAAGRAGR